MAIEIGTVKSIGRSKDLEIIPDDRQTLVKTVTSSGTGSVTVEDYGHIQNGEVISLSATFLPGDWTAVSNYWKNRTLVAVRLDDGTTISNARIVVKRVSYYDDLINQPKTVQLEVWRV